MLFSLLLVGLGHPAYAQSGCFSLTSCAQNTSVTFQCIDASAHPDIDYWINTVPLMANYASSSSTTQYLVIKGILNITTLGTNYTFKTGSEIIFVNGSSGINVNSGAKLTVNGSNLHGCQSMWAGIRLQNSSTIDVGNTSTISDAEYAIQTIGSSATLKVTNTTFLKNYCSLAFGLGGTAPTITNNGISGNTFVGNNTVLANSWWYTKPNYAVYIQSVMASIKIGEATGNTNYFADFDLFGAHCIHTEFSNVTVENSKFTCLGCSSSQNAIYALDDASTIINVTGLGTGSNVTFQNFSEAIFGSNMNLNLKDAWFKDNDYDVRDQTLAPFGSPPTINWNIQDCKLENYRDMSFSLDNDPSFGALEAGNIHIFGNNFLDNDANVPLSNAGRAAISIGSSIRAKINDCYIFNNDITHSPVSSSFNRLGIRLNNIENPTVEYNRIINNDNIFPGNFSGIQVGSCKNINLLDNSVVGASITDPSTSIYNAYSEATTLRCNYVRDTKYGISFAGQASNYANIVQNQIGLHRIGLYLGATAVIGTQNKGENRWPTSGSTSEATMDWNVAAYGAYNPLLPAHTLIVGSRGVFYINTPGITNPADIYWPSPRDVGGTADMGVWFQTVAGTPPPEVSECKDHNEDPKKLTRGDELLLEGNYPAYIGEGSMWDAQFRLFGRIKDYPELLEEEASAAWYSNQQGSVLAVLYNAYESLKSLGSTGPEQATALRESYNGLSAVIQRSNELATLAYNADADELAELQTERETNTAEIVARTADYRALLDGLRTAALQQATDLLTGLASTDDIAIYETNMKTVLQIQLNRILSGTGLSDESRIFLNDIASQCLYTGGWGVEMARQMLPENIYDDSLLCEMAGRNIPSKQIHADQEMVVFPNPVTDFIGIDIEKSFGEGIGRIYDMKGDLVQTWVFDQNFQGLSGAGLNNGIYYLSIIVDGKTLAAQKFSIIH